LNADELKVAEAFHANLHEASDFYVSPNIPAEKLSGARSTFLRGRYEELLPGLCDTTIFRKNAKDGFALMTKRIYWRDSAVDETHELAYADLHGAVHVSKGDCERASRKQTETISLLTAFWCDFRHSLNFLILSSKRLRAASVLAARSRSTTFA
jgi:hypothetical protein